MTGCRCGCGAELVFSGIFEALVCPVRSCQMNKPSFITAKLIYMAAIRKGRRDK